MFSKNQKTKEHQMWDKKSENYPRYNPNDEDFQNKAWEILQSCGALESGFSVLDIGCGTGVYTIPLGKRVQEVYAMDISSKMLDILVEDAKKHGVENIQVLHSTWEALDLDDKKFDLVFASKTPALKTPKDYQKMMDHSNKYIAYLGWAGVKQSNIQKELIKRYGFSFRKFDDTTVLKEWLDSNSIPYSTTTFEETLSRDMSYENGIVQINEYLSRLEESLSDEEIKDVLDSLLEDGKLTYRLDVKLELILWEK